MFGKARLHLGGRPSSQKPCVISGEFSDVASTAGLYEWIVRNGVLSQQKQDRKCKCNVTLRRVLPTIVAVKKQ